VIKPCAIVFPRDARCEFNQLSVVEPTIELFKEFVPDIDRRSGHADCVMERKPLEVGKRRIFFKAPKCLQLGICQTTLPADRRPDVDSEWAADHHGHFDVNNRFELCRDAPRGFLT